MKIITLIIYLIVNLLIFSFSNAEIIKDIKITGNERISNETILMFSNVNLNDEFSQYQTNDVLKDLYDTNFFENISVKFDNSILIINVKEAPIIESISISGIKAKKIKELIRKNLKLKSRNSYNEFLLSEEKKTILINLQNLGYYFAVVDPYIEELKNNMVSINFDIKLGNKAKIKKISFLGNKIFKDRTLRNVIVSEEYKFWKFISNKKFLNQELNQIDNRLLKNFYLNKGYYNVTINTSFAKLINEDEFELIFNINPNEKIYFNDLQIKYPDDFNQANYDKLSDILLELKGKPYSINAVEKILNEIDFTTTNEEFKSIKATVDEKLVSNLLDINFVINETEKFVLEKINIFGNNITREDVIRNQFEIDEGDPFNEILVNKSENNLKSLNFFKNVSSEIIEGKDKNSKIINITVEEKPTGEISAGAGVGTSGGTIAAGIKENNYLGKGLAVEVSGTITSETFKGLFSVTNPNYNNSDKSVFANVQAIEIDRLKTNGYKTNKTGFALGTDFEYLKDFNFGLSTSSFYEKIETDSTASARQKTQAGNYWDTFVKFNLFYDKRNQKFKPSDGYYSRYSLDLPVISDNNTLTNSYDYKYYTELYENNISSFSFLIETANSLTGDDIKLTERIYIPSRRLRGFERGKVGPKDGADFIGGNYLSAINFSTTLPQLFPNLQNLDTSLFIDAANIWGVDYDSSLGDNSKIRSSIGIGIDWFTVVGPLNFSLTEVITKDDNDIEESFRFNLGTTF